MAGFAKAILISIIVAVVFITFSNLMFFFPWYMSLVYETFNLSQAVANDNYLKDMYYEATMNRLKNKPIFSDPLVRDLIEITATKSDGIKSARGENDANLHYVPLTVDDQKPYKQRGEKVTVKISAVYPFRVKLANQDVHVLLPVSFELSTTGLKHYKDLLYYEDRYLPGP